MENRSTQTIPLHYVLALAAYTIAISRVTLGVAYESGSTARGSCPWLMASLAIAASHHRTLRLKKPWAAVAPIGVALMAAMGVLIAMPDLEQFQFPWNGAGWVAWALGLAAFLRTSSTQKQDRDA